MIHCEMLLGRRSTSTLQRNGWSLWCLVLGACLAQAAAGQSPTTSTATATPAAAVEPVAVVESIALDGGERLNAETATEIQQLPHPFRHQQHYSHRIEQAVNDFKRQQQQQQQHLQQQQQQPSHLKERDKNTSNASIAMDVTPIKKNNVQVNDNRNNSQHHQQHHQRRHEHHWQQLQQEQQQQKHDKNYHLRHRSHYQPAWEQRVVPTLRHQRHRNALAASSKTTATIAATTTTASSHGLPHPSTEAGNELDYNYEDDNEPDNNKEDLRSLAALSLNATAITTRKLQTRRYFDREGLFSKQHTGVATTRGPNKLRHHWQQAKYIAPKLRNQMFADETLSGPRLSLKFNAHVEGNVAEENEHVADHEAHVPRLNAHEDDDYSYEQEYDDDDADDDDQQFDTQNNDFPTSSPLLTSAQAKTAVKRFTNPFKNLFKSFGQVEKQHSVDDKYNLRVQQHHLKQQQHQRELEALRAWHGGLATNVVSGGPNKHSSVTLRHNSNNNNNNNNKASSSIAHL